MNVVDMIFLKMHRSYSGGVLFTTLLSIMWWFGIHGNNREFPADREPVIGGLNDDKRKNNGRGLSAVCRKRL